MEFAELLLSKLPQEDIQTLTQSVSEYFALPVMLVDTEYRGISFFPKQPLNDPIWDEIYQHNRVSPTIVNQLNLSNMMELGEEDTEPYFLNWGFLEQHPRILMNIFNGGRCLGYLAVLTRECSPALLEQVKLAGTAIALKLQQDQQATIPAADYKTMFFNMLLAERQMTKPQLQEWLSYFPSPPLPPYFIVAIAQNSVQESHFKELWQSIATFFPSILSAVRERNLVLLCQERQLDALLHSLEARKAASLRWGVSEPFQKLEETKRSYDQAMFALSMCGEGKQRQVFYSDVILDYITMVLNKHSSRENFLHPAIQKLQSYDQKTGLPICRHSGLM